MTKGKVSVLLTSYNRPRMVSEAIESVLNQTYTNFELWILDDDSNQETLEAIVKYTDSRIILVKLKGSEEKRWQEARYAININKVLDKIDGEFVCYLSDDDLFMTNSFRDLVGYLNEHQDISVVYGRQKILRNGGDGGLRPENRVIDNASGAVDHCQVMHRTSILEKVGNWPTFNIRCADGEFWGKLNNSGYKFYPIDSITSIHRYHENELSSKIERGEIDKEPRE